MISENRRLQYLAALGVDAWISRERAMQTSPVMQEVAPAESANDGAVAHYIIGPGNGQTLLLCRTQDEVASRLASDIARCLDEAPVWGWLAQQVPGAEPAGLDLETAVRERLFTRVLVFDARTLDPDARAETIGIAQVIRAPALLQLAHNPGFKRNLWSQLVANGWNKRFG